MATPPLTPALRRPLVLRYGSVADSAHLSPAVPSIPATQREQRAATVPLTCTDNSAKPPGARLPNWLSEFDSRHPLHGSVKAVWRRSVSAPRRSAISRLLAAGVQVQAPTVSVVVTARPGCRHTCPESARQLPPSREEQPPHERYATSAGEYVARSWSAGEGKVVRLPGITMAAREPANIRPHD